MVTFDLNCFWQKQPVTVVTVTIKFLLSLLNTLINFFVTIENKTSIDINGHARVASGDGFVAASFSSSISGR